jgi:hypothetical protein
VKKQKGLAGDTDKPFSAWMCETIILFHDKHNSSGTSRNRKTPPTPCEELFHAANIYKFWMLQFFLTVPDNFFCG